MCVLIAAVFIASCRWWLLLQVPTPYGPAVIAEGGALQVIASDQYEVLCRARLKSTLVSRTWNYWDAGDGFIFVPIYALFLAAALPTLLVWRFVPKFPRGHCRRCGYSLTALTEARCPECGAGFGFAATIRRPSRSG